jgi:signal transduction histidine kinase
VEDAAPRDTEPATRAGLDEGEHRLAAYIAHELRNPLSSIQALAKVLDLRYKSISPQERAAAIQSMEIDAQRALLILDGLLNLAKKRSQHGADCTQIPLHAVLRKVVADHQRRNPERQIELSGDSPLYTRGDSVGLELALGNLLNNAEKYAPRNTAIEITSREEGNRTTILIMNGGASLPGNVYQKLWDVYSHGPDPEIAVSGTGIGLALCKELIETMGGRVWAGPRRSGGSVFAVTLATFGDISPRASLKETLSA